jgi:pimeloyl-ACP methyl ester carboxylesterase
MPPDPSRTVLLLHAYPLSAAMWAGQKTALEAAGLTVLAPSLPGFGGEPGAMSSLADTARKLLDTLPPEPVALVGLSMGGYLALALLAEGRAFIVTAAEQEHSPSTFRQVRPMIGAASREGIAGALRAMAERSEQRETLRTLNVPLLVLVGEHDEITPPGQAQEIADAGRGTLHIVPGAAHLSNLDAPDAFNAALLAFLR